jgi:hypothetical protein
VASSKILRSPKFRFRRRKNHIVTFVVFLRTIWVTCWRILCTVGGQVVVFAYILLDNSSPVLGIRIRMFLGLPDPDPGPLVRVTDRQASGRVPAPPGEPTGCFGFVLSRLLRVRGPLWAADFFSPILGLTVFGTIFSEKCLAPHWLRAVVWQASGRVQAPPGEPLDFLGLF